MNDMLYIFA